MTDKTMDTLKIGVDIYASEITLTITADEASEILSALSESAENKGDSISRQAVLDLLQMKYSGKELYKAIYELPSVENKGEDSKVAKGQWIKFENVYKCSECGHIMDKVLSVSGNLIYQYSNYCPECGKKMSLEEPTEEEVQAFWLEAINSRCM